MVQTRVVSKLMKDGACNRMIPPFLLLETGEVNTPSNREQRYAATDLIFLFDHKAEFIQIV